MEVSKKISYIIGYRQSNYDRERALLFVISYLRKWFPLLEIIVVEQATESHFSPPENLQIKHLFIKNTGHYNQCKSFNLGAKNASNAIFFFSCSDIFLIKEDFATCFEAAHEFEAITPNKIEAINIKISNLENHEFIEIGKRPMHNFAGGLFSLTREAFEKIGGWDERFEGWGGDDDAMSHVILQKLKSKTIYLPMYHIDHPRTIKDTNEQVKYTENRSLSDEISTKYGNAIDYYIRSLQKMNQHYFEHASTIVPHIDLTEKNLKFVLAVSTYNRVHYLKALMDSFFATRSEEVTWKIIIADDGSTDETKMYLEELSIDNDIIIIHNNRVDVHRQMNTILKALSEIEYDVCFRCDDDLVFQQAGWDDLYWQTMQRTQYDHLIFYDRNWRADLNLVRPVQYGGLVSYCLAEHIQGAFYTLTPKIHQAVGFYDEQQFGRRGLGHVDFSFRCCRAGFNVISNPFDVVGSNEYLKLQPSINYVGTVSSKYRAIFNSKEVIEIKKSLTTQNRIYLPYNENYYSENDIGDKLGVNISAKNVMPHQFKKADSAFHPERGIIGFFGFLLKRFYNFTIDFRLFFIPKGIKWLGRVLNKIGLDLMRIEE